MGIVYMLYTDYEYYIGSTIRELKKRLANHKYKKYNIYIIEEVVGETKEDCRFREQWWIEFYGKENLINKINAIDNPYREEDWRKKNKDYVYDYNKEYYKYHKEELIKKNLEYVELHKDLVKKRKKDWYLKNKERILNKIKSKK